VTIDRVRIGNRIYWTLWYTQIVTTLHNCHTYTNGLSRGLHQSSGNGFQKRTFPFLWISELSPCLTHSNSRLTHQPALKNSSLTHTANCPAYHISRRTSRIHVSEKLSSLHLLLRLSNCIFPSGFPMRNFVQIPRAMQVIHIFGCVSFPLVDFVPRTDTYEVLMSSHLSRHQTLIPREVSLRINKHFPITFDFSRLFLRNACSHFLTTNKQVYSVFLAVNTSLQTPNSQLWRPFLQF
jgi:hypothetical protein